MRRAGARDQIPSVFMLVALAALTASLPWPFVAASHTIALLDRGFFSILTWTLGALIAGWLLSWVIRFVAGIHMSGFGDDRAASLIGFLKVFDWVATLAVPALVTAAYVAALRQSGYYY